MQGLSISLHPAPPPPINRVLAAVLLASLGAVGAALVSQHVFEMMPCAWCVLQRLIFLGVAAGAALGLLWRSGLGRRIGAILVLDLSLAGAAAALWQHFVAAKSASCAQTLADRIMTTLQLDALLPEVFAAYANCADSKVNLFGVPYEFWSFALFAVLAAAGAWAVTRRAR